IASSSFRRCPTAVTPSSFRVSCVRLGRTVSSISFSRNAASYFPRPRLRSQTTMSMTGAPQSWVAHIIRRGSEGVQGGFGVLRVFANAALFGRTAVISQLEARAKDNHLVVQTIDFFLAEPILSNL